MAKVWKAISSTIAVLLTLAIVFGAGYFVGSYPSDEAEVVEPIAPVEEEFNLELPAEVEKRIVTVEEIEVVLVDISQFSTYCGEYTATKSADYTRYFLDNIAVPVGCKQCVRRIFNNCIKLPVDGLLPFQCCQ